MASLALSAFGGCGSHNPATNDGEKNDTPQVERLTSPADGTTVDLNLQNELLFSWPAATCDCEAATLYNILFSKERECNDPVAKLTSDGDGHESKATLSKTALDQIAADAGAKSDESITLYWTVEARTEGTSATTLAKEVRSITIIRFDGTQPKVTALVAPEDKASIDLRTGGDITFSWKEATTSDVDDVTYRLSITKSDGTFLAPLLDTLSDNSGRGTSITIPMSRLDGIALKAGVAEGQRANLQWAVKTVSDKDGEVISDEVRQLVLGRQAYFTNPIMDKTVAMADPWVIKGHDGYYYVYATGPRLKRARSKDMVNWEMIEPAFKTRPQHVEGATGIWAPDVEYINGQYVMYYSQNVTMPGGNPNSTIGIATCATPDGSFTDRGILMQAKDVGIPGGCIDAFYFDDNGQKYLFFGSFKGIYGYKLTDDGLAIDGDVTKPYQIAGNSYEGGMLYKQGDYYYLFASIGRCCDGKDSTYELVVGRSKNILGPYVNMKGEKMMNNNHKLIMTSSDRFVGPGHCSGIVEDANGDLWLYYHAYDMTANNGDPKARALMLDQVTFGPKGWPNIRETAPNPPSERSVAPAL